MKKFAFAVLVLSQLSLAALPPLYQSVNELDAVIHDKGVQKKIGSGRTIVSITRKNGDKATYRVKTSGHCVLEATLVFEVPPQGWAGPATIESVETSELRCPAGN